MGITFAVIKVASQLTWKRRNYTRLFSRASVITPASLREVEGQRERFKEFLLLILKVKGKGLRAKEFKQLLKADK